MQSIFHMVFLGYGALFTRTVGQAEYRDSMIYAEACHRTKPDEGTAVLAAMIVGTLHECTLGKDVTHLQVGAYGSVQVAKYRTAHCLIIILFHYSNL